MENQVDNLYDKNDIIVRRSTVDDIFYLQSRLRESDVREIWACSNRTPTEALERCLKESIFCCTILNGSPIGVFGISPVTILGNRASVWFLATNGLEKIQRRFIKNSRYFIKMMLDFYPYLYNWVDDRNKDSIRWLRMCGATVEEPKPYGKEQLPFRYFYFQHGGKDV